MKIVFMGTSAFAVPSLRALAESRYELAAAVTQPDRPAGRGLRPRPSPVKQAAVELGLQILQSEKIRSPESRQALKEMAADLFVVAAYGQILSPSVLEMPRLGCLNLHASLLPKYRGAAPIRRALMAGESQTGVTTMWMSEGVDEGDIILQRSLEIGLEENYGSLHDRLAEAGAEVLMETLAAVDGGPAPRQPQEHSLATFAPPLRGEETKIEWTRSAAEIHNLVRALDPAPGGYCLWRGKRLKLWRVEKNSGVEGIPGRMVEVGATGPLVASGQGGLRLTEVQPEGRKRMSGSEFVRGYRPRVGELLE